MSSFHFSRIDSRSPIVTWSLAAIGVGLLLLLIIDARLFAQYMATLLVSALIAAVAVVGLSRSRTPVIAKKKKASR